MNAVGLIWTREEKNVITSSVKGMPLPGMNATSTTTSVEAVLVGQTRKHPAKAFLKIVTLNCNGEELHGSTAFSLKAKRTVKHCQFASYAGLCLEALNLRFLTRAAANT